jgi:hypothetical protein
MWTPSSRCCMSWLTLSVKPLGPPRPLLAHRRLAIAQSTATDVSPRGTIFLNMDTDFSPLACVRAGDLPTYIVLFPQQKLFKEIYASLLAGITNDVTMRVRIDPASEVCKVAYVTITRP